MIYLINTTYYNKETKEVIDLLKIGYTKNVNKRFDAYLLHNPECKLLDIREGDIDLENYFHKIYSKYKYDKRDEWFYYNQEIIDNFRIIEINNNLLDKNIKKLEKYTINLLLPKNDDLVHIKSNVLKYIKDKFPDEYIKFEFSLNRNSKDSLCLFVDYLKYYIKDFDFTILSSIVLNKEKKFISRCITLC